jgi:hypothetical protein
MRKQSIDRSDFFTRIDSAHRSVFLFVFSHFASASLAKAAAALCHSFPSHLRNPTQPCLHLQPTFTRATLHGFWCVFSSFMLMLMLIFSLLSYPFLPFCTHPHAISQTSTALVMLMIPGLGYFYSGLARHKNALSLIFLSMLSLSVVLLQWFLWGFSLAFSPTSGPFIGDLSYAFLMGLFDEGVAIYPGLPTIPASVFMIYQGTFFSRDACLH